jgi:hypothetical protein
MPLRERLRLRLRVVLSRFVAPVPPLLNAAALPEPGPDKDKAEAGDVGNGTTTPLSPDAAA